MFQAPNMDRSRVHSHTAEASKAMFRIKNSTVLDGHPIPSLPTNAQSAVFRLIKTGSGVFAFGIWTFLDMT
jgi:hypothetical protein